MIAFPTDEQPAGLSGNRGRTGKFMPAHRLIPVASIGAVATHIEAASPMHGWSRWPLNSNTSQGLG